MIKKLTILTMCASLQAQELKTVTIEERLNTQIVQDVSRSDIKSADLADALQKSIPSINLIRRSGIANDILLRGQKRDNINIIIDGTKVQGACVNRMDPPTSHILTNNVDTVQVTEGPFDVENFGTLSGLVNIQTKKPKKGLHGDMGINVGSFGYQKFFGSVSGGKDKIKALLSASTEKSNPYKDGEGNTLAQQIKNTPNTQMFQYQPKYENIDAYQKQTLLAKLFFDITSNQELRLSYTANRSDNILYPSSKMDALYDDSNIYNLQYRLRDLSPYSTLLTLQLYKSDVAHPMSTRYRKAGAKNYLTHQLTTTMQGAKLKNSFDAFKTDFTLGLDISKRNWDGHFTKNDQVLKMSNGKPMPKSLNDVDTTNKALFLKAKNNIDNTSVHYGLRYDDTQITTANPKEDARNFSALSANVFATLQADESLSYFLGLGKSSRVPDPRELYLFMMGNHTGTPDLKQTQNYEIDVGFEKIYDSFSLKTKVYYSALKDYIAYNATRIKTKPDGKKGAFHSFENMDATLYGIEVSGAYLVDEDLYVDYGLSYKRGTKDDPLSKQQGTNLPDMRPLKANIALHMDYHDTHAKLECIAASKWDNIDAENGEQTLPAYAIINLKASQDLYKDVTLTIGIDNLLDKSYAITNTYKDLTLLTTGTGVNDVMLMREPGRYFYAQASYTF